MRNALLPIGSIATAAILTAACTVPPPHTAFGPVGPPGRFAQPTPYPPQGPFGPAAQFGPAPPTGQPLLFGGDKMPYLNHHDGTFGTSTHITYGAPHPFATVSYRIY